MIRVRGYRAFVRWISAAACFWLAPCVYAQTPYVLRFIPGVYLADNKHRIILYNPSSVSRNISGYYLVTRDYSVRLPSGAVIPPGKTYTIGKKNDEKNKLDFELSKSPDFLIRLYGKKIEGNYFVFFDPNLRVLDAMYNAQISNVPFLPDSGAFWLRNGKRLTYHIPPAGNRSWGYFPVGDDPAIGFEQIDDKWRVISADPTANVYPATAFRDMTARFQSGEVRLEWFTEFEDGVKKIEIERSEDKQNFATINLVEGRGVSATFNRYLFYDGKVTADKNYSYRLKHVDIVGNVIYSKVVELFTREPIRAFWLDVFPTQTPDARQINVRFFSAFSQQVKIKLVDEKFREIALLFDDLVYAESQNLLRFTEGLPPGRYLLLAFVERKRFFQEIIIVE